MGKYFIGKGVQLLTEETENKIRIYKLGLLQPEFGHSHASVGMHSLFYWQKKEKYSVR